MNPKSYYDESLFVDGVAVEMYDAVGVSNRADEYLVRRRGKTPRPVSVETPVAVNPAVPCHGVVNINTMRRRHCATHRVYCHSRIRVVDGGGDDATGRTTTPIVIGEREPGVVYDYNERLTSLEMAIMLKYHSLSAARGDNGDGADDVKRPPSITPLLYHVVRDHFVERVDSCASPTDRCERDWFDVTEGCGGVSGGGGVTPATALVTMTADRELVHRCGSPACLPDLTVCGPEVSIRG